MALKWEGWHSDPALNNSAPPKGAPENATRYRDSNDIMRYIMAAVWEIGNLLTTTGASIGTLGTQDKDAVDIEGGSIINTTLSSTCSINAAALKSGTIPDARFDPAGAPNARELQGLTIQQIYDAVYPVGTIRLTTNDATSYPVPSPIVATWSRVVTNRYVKIIEPNNYDGDTNRFMTFGHSTNTTSLGGEHAHGQFTLDTTLTIAQIPNHDHSVGGLLTSDNDTGYRSEAVVQNSGTTRSGKTGGGQPHKHGIDMANPHTHTVAIDPEGIGFIAWQRTA